MVICFTGHRSLHPQNLSESLCLLENKLEALASRDEEIIFRAGGAIGFDTIAALSVIALKAVHPNVRLHLILPCKDQTKGWTSGDVQKYNYILSVADSVTYTGENYTKYCMHTRNRALVDGADLCIAYFNGNKKGGTYYTVNYADQRGVSVENIWVD